MDKVAAYKKIARQIVEEIAALETPSNDVETQLIVDDEHGHYLLHLVGWQNKQWHYGSLVHIDVKNDGKVWLQHDGTDLPVALELMRNGVSKQDIVFGFQSPQERTLHYD